MQLVVSPLRPLEKPPDLTLKSNYLNTSNLHTMHIPFREHADYVNT